MTQEWKISRRQKSCHRCGRAFADPEKHFSSLFLKGEDLEREDLCVPCWGPGQSSPDGSIPDRPAEALLWWRTTHSEGKRRVALNLEVVEALFHRLDGRPELRLRELRFLLCLILMRKRRLKLSQTVRGGRGGDAEGEGFLVRKARTGEEFWVEVFHFGPERMRELQGELRRTLDGVDVAEVEESGGGEPREVTPALSDPMPASGPVSGTADRE